MIINQTLLVVCLLVGLTFAALHQFVANTPIENADGSGVNVSTILNAVGTPLCMRRCAGRLAFSAKKFISFEDTTEKFKDLCDSYNATRTCLDRKIACGPRNVYDAVTSGIEHACVTKRASFDRVESCLKGSIDGILQKCDSACYFRSNLTVLSSNPTIQMAATFGGNLMLTAAQLPPFCDTTRCMIPCVVKAANEVCPLSGWLLVDSLLQPFDKAAALFAKAPPLIQQLVRDKLTSRCYYLFDTSSLDALRRGQFDSMPNLS